LTSWIPIHLKECLVRPCCLELAQFYPASIQAGHFWRNRYPGAWPFLKEELEGIADIHQCGGAKNRQLSAVTLHQASRHQRPAVDQPSTSTKSISLNGSDWCASALELITASHEVQKVP